MAITRTVTATEIVIREEPLVNPDGTPGTPRADNPKNVTLRMTAMLANYNDQTEEWTGAPKMVVTNDPTRILRLVRKALGQAPGASPDAKPGFDLLDPDAD